MPRKPKPVGPAETEPLRPNYSREELKRDMMRGVITEPLLSMVQKKPAARYDIIVALSETYPEGVEEARKLVTGILKQLKPPAKLGLDAANYVFANLTGRQILALAKENRDWAQKGGTRWTSPVYRVWHDAEVRACLTKSIATIKADASHRAFNSQGAGILWAVLDSGIDSTHPHFAGGTIETELCKDFFNPDGNGLDDQFGHGTHVAGIIAGGWKSDPPRQVAVTEALSESGDKTDLQLEEVAAICGIAPKAKLVSLKVLDANGVGKASTVLQAMEEVQRINKYGRWLRIHGVNMSLGYDFNPRWFACGQSPLCVEVNRLVRSGVVVVVAAGNSGFSSLNRTAQGTNELGYRDLSINDPGNAELAITVGATHRDMPHTYGVSYFSSRGPTGDGRLKPDLVAPGERIVSCAAGNLRAGFVQRLPPDTEVLYLEQSGTSMAAPHVSGAIAAFLSTRREFIGQPEKVKQLFLNNAIDLGRERTFQGHGLLDLLKVLQAV